jgi:hypothetical protein
VREKGGGKEGERRENGRRKAGGREEGERRRGGGSSDLISKRLLKSSLEGRTDTREPWKDVMYCSLGGNSVNFSNSCLSSRNVADSGIDNGKTIGSSCGCLFLVSTGFLEQTHVNKYILRLIKKERGS